MESFMYCDQELQEKHNALVERMAGVLESDRGKGRQGWHSEGQGAEAGCGVMEYAKKS